MGARVYNNRRSSSRNINNKAKGPVFSPLGLGLAKKRNTTTIGATFVTKHQDHNNTQTVPQRDFSLYVGESFTVKIPFSTDLNHLVRNTAMPGFVMTDFFGRSDIHAVSLSTGGTKMLSVPNAGGSSVISEVLSFEVLGRCFGANLTKTEMEISYFPKGGSMTDYVCEMSHTTVGVSVTRAMKFQGDYDIDDAMHLLNKKLKGIIQSTLNSNIKWTKQILHVWSSSDFVTNTLAQAYCELGAGVKANTVVLVSTAPKADYIFKNT